MSFALITGCKKSDLVTSNEALSPEKSNPNLFSRNPLPFELESVSLNGGDNLNLLTLDSIASIHNEAMEYLVGRIESENVCPNDKEEFRNNFAIYIQDFFQERGLLSTSIKINSIEDSRAYDEADFCVDDYALSTKGSKIICNLQNTFDNFTANSISDNEFITEVNKLVSEANEIEDTEERKVVQLSATICKSSSIFWKYNLDRLTTTLRGICNDRGSFAANKNSIPWGGVASADALGALNWGRVGFFAAGGPAGAVACGLAGAAGQSAVRLLCFGIFGS